MRYEAGVFIPLRYVYRRHIRTCLLYLHTLRYCIYIYLLRYATHMVIYATLRYAYIYLCAPLRYAYNGYIYATLRYAPIYIYIAGTYVPA